MKRATVTWGDAFYNSGYFSTKKIEEDHGPMIVQTTGWVVVDDEKGISLAVDFRPDSEAQNADEFHHVHFIPRGMIQSVEYWPEDGTQA